MNTPESLREFTRELVRRGLPVDYAWHAAEELAGHHRDLVEELRSSGMDEVAATVKATERLGETKSLVKKTVRAYQRRYWCGRWPLLTFCVGPFALLLGAWIGTFLGMFVLGKSLELIGHPIPESSRQLSIVGLVLLYAGVGWCLLVVPAGIIAFLARRAYRISVSSAWVLVAATIIGLCAGNIRCGFEPSLANSDHPFMITLPVWYPFQSLAAFASWYARSPQQLAQTATPLLVAVLLMAHSWHVRRRVENSLSAC